MKYTEYYDLWICYGRKKWNDLERRFDTYSRAEEVAIRIAAGHKPTTKVAVVRTTITKDTMSVYNGERDERKPSAYQHCNLCGNKRFRKNINQNTGTCVTCEMRKAAK